MSSSREICALPQSCTRLEQLIYKRVLGSGRSSTVFETWDQSTRKKRALRLLNATQMQTVEHELKIHQTIPSHANIIYASELLALDPARHNSALCMVMDVMECSLRDCFTTMGYPFPREQPGTQWPLLPIAPTTHLPLHLLAHWMHHACMGLAHLHRNRWVHCDVKPENMLIGSDGILHVSDFSLTQPIGQRERPSASILDMSAAILPTSAVTTCQSLWYRPPEILLGQTTAFGPVVDSWALGVVMLECAGLGPWLYGDSEIGQLYCIFHTFGTPTEQTWPGVSCLPYFKTTFPRWSFQDQTKRILVERLGEQGWDMLQHLLCMDPNQRWTPEQALKHPFFQHQQPYFYPTKTKLFFSDISNMADKTDATASKATPTPVAHSKKMLRLKAKQKSKWKRLCYGLAGAARKQDTTVLNQLIDETHTWLVRMNGTVNNNIQWLGGLNKHPQLLSVVQECIPQTQRARFGMFDANSSAAQNDGDKTMDNSAQKVDNDADTMMLTVDQPQPASSHSAHLSSDSVHLSTPATAVRVPTPTSSLTQMALPIMPRTTHEPRIQPEASFPVSARAEVATTPVFVPTQASQALPMADTTVQSTTLTRTAPVATVPVATAPMTSVPVSTNVAAMPAASQTMTASRQAANVEVDFDLTEETDTDSERTVSDHE